MCVRNRIGTIDAVKEESCLVKQFCPASLVKAIPESFAVFRKETNMAATEHRKVMPTDTFG